MLHVRLFDVSTVSLSMASGVVLLGLPTPASIVASGSLALIALMMLSQRDAVSGLGRPRSHNRDALAPFEGAREPVRVPDAEYEAAAARNSDLASCHEGLADLRLAPVTEHAFGKGDKVDFIFEGWDAGDIVFSGEVVGVFRNGCKVRVSDGETYFVPRAYLVLVEAAR